MTYRKDKLPKSKKKKKKISKKLLVASFKKALSNVSLLVLILVLSKVVSFYNEAHTFLYQKIYALIILYYQLEYFINQQSLIDTQTTFLF